MRVWGARAPPLQASPLREKLGIERTRFVGALGFKLRTDGKNFAGVGGAHKNSAVFTARNAGNLRGAGLGKLRENAARIDGEKRSVVTGSGEETAIGREP